jgi:hypothetical protein
MEKNMPDRQTGRLQTEGWRRTCQTDRQVGYRQRDGEEHARQTERYRQRDGEEHARQADRHTGTDRAGEGHARQTDRYRRESARANKQTNGSIRSILLLYLFIFLRRFDASTVAVATQLYQLSFFFFFFSSFVFVFVFCFFFSFQQSTTRETADAKPPFHDYMLSLRRDSNRQLKITFFFFLFGFIGRRFPLNLKA